MAYSIGDVSRVLGITASALHYYEKEGLLHMPKEDAGWRSYEEEDVYRLISVKKYRAMGVSLREIARQFSDDGMNAQEILLRMREKRDEAAATARHYQTLSEDIGRLIAVGEGSVGREGVVDIRPVEDVLVFRSGDGGVIPRGREAQAAARVWLEAMPAVSLGIARDPGRERAEMALLIARERAREYGIQETGEYVRLIRGGMALHAVVSCGMEQYEDPDSIFTPILQFAREHHFTPAGEIWGATLFVDCSGGERRYYYDTYMVFE